MARSDFSIELGAQWDAWEDGFERMAEGDLDDEFVNAWQGAADVMFATSQEYVHILSGDLKSSGIPADVQIDGRDLVAEIVYTADYAIYEHARGGEHAWLQRAYVATERIFERVLPSAWEKVVARWK